jgi:hypothetical protein
MYYVEEKKMYFFLIWWSINEKTGVSAGMEMTRKYRIRTT